MKCEKCKTNDAKNQQCNGDGGVHGHGRVHTVDGDLIALCDSCHALDKKDWEASFAIQKIMKEA